jgi:flavodoxin I
MSKVAIIYDSATHNTEIMAKAIAEGVKAEGIEVRISHVHEAKIKDIEGNLPS